MFTHARLESVRAARLQLLDLGDTKTAKTLDWVVLALGCLQAGITAQESPALLVADLLDHINALSEKLGDAAPDQRELLSKVNAWLEQRDQVQAQPQAPAIFLVATGVEVEGEETYTRHEGSPPPLCDFEGPLYPDTQDLARRLYKAEGQVSNLKRELADARECISDWVTYGAKITDALGVKVMSPDRHLAEIARLRAALAASQPAPVAWVWNPACEAWERVRAPGHWQPGAIYAFGPNQPESFKLAAPVEAQAVPDMRDAYTGAREDLEDWKRRALVAEKDTRRLDCLLGQFWFGGAPPERREAIKQCLCEAEVIEFVDAELAAAPTPTKGDANA